MGFCPICKTSSNLEQPTGGDYRRVECRKCGKFQITGSASAMLESRLNDAKSAARLSHATRAMSSKSGAEWPEINSFNLDDMIKGPLPSVDRQMTNLLAWAATELDDDQLGSVELPDEDDLTAVIGTLDGQRVDDLISHTDDVGLIRIGSHEGLSDFAGLAAARYDAEPGTAYLLRPDGYVAARFRHPTRPALDAALACAAGIN